MLIPWKELDGMFGGGALRSGSQTSLRHTYVQEVRGGMCSREHLKGLYYHPTPRAIRSLHLNDES